ncbi:MAG TPA: hypothetical protein DCZ23_07865 [Lachnospiraceae bacterium]|nr:hypothetical protein [Lachnospiraceae bacterium]
MKKWLLNFTITVILSMFLSGCMDDSIPQTVHKYEHDMDDAIAMIDEAEWYCAWLQTQDFISRSNVEALIGHLDSIIDGIGTDIVCTQMDLADWENSNIEELSFHNESSQPTIYHKGISVVSAKEEHSCQTMDGNDSCQFHFGTLAIRKEYSGDDPALQGWYLEYIFQQTEHGGEWAFSCYNGTYNIDAHLELKKSFYKSDYDTVSFQNH